MLLKTEQCFNIFKPCSPLLKLGESHICILLFCLQSIVEDLFSKHIIYECSVCRGTRVKNVLLIWLRHCFWGLICLAIFAVGSLKRKTFMMIAFAALMETNVLVLKQSIAGCFVCCGARFEVASSVVDQWLKHGAAEIFLVENKRAQVCEILACAQKPRCSKLIHSPKASARNTYVWTWTVWPFFGKQILYVLALLLMLFIVRFLLLPSSIALC